MEARNAKRKMLKTDKQFLIEACSETFRQIEMIDENNGEESASEQETTNGKESEVSTTLSCDKEFFESQEVTNSEENNSSIPVSVTELSNDDEMETNFPAKCRGDSCPCSDSHKLWQHLVGVLSSDKNPIPFYGGFPNGDIMLKGDLFQDQEGDFFDDIIALNVEFISGTIMPIEDNIFSECPRLSLLCKMACHRMVPMLLMSIIHAFAELEKKDNIRFEYLPASPAKVVASLRVSQVTSRDVVDVKVFTTVEESVKLKIGKLDTNKNVRHQARTSNVQ